MATLQHFFTNLTCVDSIPKQSEVAFQRVIGKPIYLKRWYKDTDYSPYSIKNTSFYNNY